ncbi:hypothetical protein B0T42_13040 [Rathayibacter sp. VKM Ac-2630]|nr:hypothetical protein B0T42_13040 [Rathayibacter sp. VKM Ac-2630]
MPTLCSTERPDGPQTDGSHSIVTASTAKQPNPVPSWMRAEGVTARSDRATITVIAHRAAAIRSGAAE